MATAKKIGTDRSSAKIDGEVASALSEFCKAFGHSQQHVVSAAAFLYMCMPPDARATTMTAYAQWLRIGAPVAAIDPSKFSGHDLAEVAEEYPLNDRLQGFRDAIEAALSRNEVMSLAVTAQKLVVETREGVAGRRRSNKQ